MAHDPDLPNRLSNLYRLSKEGQRYLAHARDEAAYDLRMAYASGPAARETGLDEKQIWYWATRHAERRGLPSRFKRLAVLDLSNAVDISTLGSEQPPTAP
jgi:hypothetical protein